MLVWHVLFLVQKAGFMLVEVSFARNVKEKRNVVITVRAHTGRENRSWMMPNLFPHRNTKMPLLVHLGSFYWGLM